MSTPAVSLNGLQGMSEDALSFWFLLIFTFVLFVAPQSLFPILSPAHLALVAGGLATILYVRSRLLPGRPLSVNRPEYRLALWLVLVAILSIPFSRWPAGSFDSLINRFSKVLIVYFLLGNTVNTLRRMKLMIGVIGLSGIIIALVALHAYVRGPFDEGGRITGYDSPLNSDPNYVAITLNLILPLIIGLSGAMSDPRKRVFFFPVMGILAGGVIVTFSRGGFLGLATILAIVFTRLPWKRPLRALIPLFLALPLILLLLPSGYPTRLYSIVNFSHYQTGSILKHLLNMRAALSLMLENPLLGVGFDVGDIAIGDVLGPDLQQKVHNVYLQIGLDLGLPGLVIYLLLVARLLKGLQLTMRQLRGLPEERTFYALGQGVEVALLSFIVQGLFYPVAYDFYFYYIAGLGVAFQEVVRHSFATQEVSASSP